MLKICIEFLAKSYHSVRIIIRMMMSILFGTMNEALAFFWLKYSDQIFPEQKALLGNCYNRHSVRFVFLQWKKKMKWSHSNYIAHNLFLGFWVSIFEQIANIDHKIWECIFCGHLQNSLYANTIKLNTFVVDRISLLFM